MDPVTCRRCHGLMHPIDPLDPLDAKPGGKSFDVRAWRCMTCGDLIDPVIMRNRSLPREHRVRGRDSTPRHPVFKELDVEWPVWR